MELLVLIIRNWKLVLFLLALVAAPVTFAIWLDRHDTRLLSGYVAQAEMEAMKAKLAEADRQKKISDQTAANFARRLAAAQASEAQVAADLEKGVANYEKRLAETKRSCLATADDIDFILRHR